MKNQQKNYTNQFLQNLIKKSIEKYRTFIDNIWGTDLADMQLISKFNKGFRFLFCVIDIYSICIYLYAWVITLKDKKIVTITNTFQKFLKESNCKPNKTWLDIGSEFYNRPMKLWLKKMTQK